MGKKIQLTRLGRAVMSTVATVTAVGLITAPVAEAFAVKPVKPSWAGETRIVYFEVYDPVTNEPVPNSEWRFEKEPSEAEDFYNDWEDENLPDYYDNRDYYQVRDNNWTSDDDGEWLQKKLIRDLDPRVGHIAISTDDAGFFPVNNGREMQSEVRIEQYEKDERYKKCDAEGNSSYNDFTFDSSEFPKLGTGENLPEIEGFRTDQIWHFGRYYNCNLYRRPPTIDVPWTKAPPVTVTSTVMPAPETKVVEQDSVTLAPSTVTATAAPEEVDGPSVTVTSTAPANTTTLAPVTVTASPVKKEVAGPVTTIQGRTVTVPGSTVSVPGGTNVSTVTLPASVVTQTETVTQEPATVVSMSSTSQTAVEKEKPVEVEVRKTVTEASEDVTVEVEDREVVTVTPEDVTVVESTPQMSDTSTPRILASTGANIAGFVSIAGLLAGAAVFIIRRKK